MNPIIYILSLFYRWYNSRESTKDIAYYSAILAFELFLFMNILSLIKYFNLWNIFPLNWENNSNDGMYITIIVVAISFGFIISLLAPQKDVKSINYDLRDQDTDYFVLVVYIIASFVLLFISAKTGSTIL